eukprot:COSAG04_NODE_725_length_10792_cov_4.701206_6_plen_74_part_00
MGDLSDHPPADGRGSIRVQGAYRISSMPERNERAKTAPSLLLSCWLPASFLWTACPYQISLHKGRVNELSRLH